MAKGIMTMTGMMMTTTMMIELLLEKKPRLGAVFYGLRSRISGSGNAAHISAFSVYPRRTDGYDPRQSVCSGQWSEVCHGSAVVCAPPWRIRA